MDWKKFLSRKFLLAVATIILGFLKALYPDTVEAIPWPVVGVALAYIFGEGGRDILRDYAKYKGNSDQPGE